MLQGLKARWMKLANYIDPHPDMKVMEKWWQKLVEAYSQPHRHYHTLEHVAACLAELDRVQESFACPQVAEFALWFHDAVYEIGAIDNELRSNTMAKQCARELGLGDGFIGLTEDYIMITDYQNLPESSPDSALKVADIDCSILGQDEKTFDRYEQGIRAEYGQYSDADYNNGRRMFLMKLLTNSMIYHTPDFQELYEAKARANIARLIARLSA